MSSNTPNLDLLKKNPSTDGNDTFNIKTMLNDNWDKIDEAVSVIGEKVTDHSSRLDTAIFADVTFNPGLQIVNSARASRFSLGSIKGRTLINLAGRLGKADDPSKLVNYQLTSSVEPNGTKITLLSGTGSLAVRPISYKAGKKYILLSDVKNGNITSDLFVQAAGGSSLEMPAIIKSLDTAKFVTVVTKLAPSADISSGSLETVFTGTSGQYAWVKNMRVYEISDVEYAAIDKMTSEQLAAKYPYVDSVQPVRNPYAIRYGENLLPPFYEWNLGTSVVNIDNPYKISLIATAEASLVFYDIWVAPNTKYTLNAQHNGWIGIYKTDGETSIAPYTQATRLTFNSGDNNVVRIYLSKRTLAAGTYTFTNPMLNIGDTAKPFKPREDAMLALQTELFADQITGNTGDEVFVQQGQYFKLKKWKKVVLDGGVSWSYIGTASGFKRVKLSITDALSSNGSNSWITKYDGSLVPYGDSHSLSDVHHIITSQGGLFISIPNVDSGWGENYSPTAAEIKAYFLGWRMYDGSTQGNPYNGTGAKTWNSIPGWGTPTYSTTTLPTTLATSYSPYELVYRLATPTVEPIISEGALMLVEGNNQVEVGTGIVVRESMKPTHYVANGNYYINNTAVNGSLLKNKVSLMLRVYRNGQVDNSAKIENDANAYGKQHIRFLPSDFDQTAAYSVTYLMLDKSPIVPFTGSAAANEKALLQDIVALETSGGGQLKADAVVTSLKDYSDNSFYKKSTFTLPNLIKNSSAAFGFNNWTRTSDIGPWGTAFASDVGGYFYINGAVSSGQYAVLDSDPIPVAPGAEYTYSVSYYTGSITTGVIQTEIRNAGVGGETIAALPADLNTVWHRKTVTITVPAGVTSIIIRLVMTNVPSGPTKAISRLKFSFGSQETPYSSESDDVALFQYASSGKSAIASAITGKGVAASGSDTFPQLATKIGQISTGSRIVYTQSGTNITTSGSYKVVDIPSGKSFVYIPDWDSPSYTWYSGAAFFNAYWGSGASTSGSSAIGIGLQKLAGGSYYSLYGDVSAHSAATGSHFSMIHGFEVSNGVNDPTKVQYRNRIISGGSLTWSSWNDISTATLSPTETNSIVFRWTVVSGSSNYNYVEYNIKGMGLIL